MACVGACASVACGGATPAEISKPAAGAAPTSAANVRPSSVGMANGKEGGSPLTDGTEVAFRERFEQPSPTPGQLGPAWNLFGVAMGKREVHVGADGLSIQVLSGEKAWDAVGARTSRVRVDGDFDLRGRFRDFSSDGNGASKLIVVDAAAPRGEAAYVERIQIDGKNLFKVGGEVSGSLEDWGFVPTDAKAADLRLIRKGGLIQGFYRTGEQGPWHEIAAGQPVPKSMPKIVKFGVKQSGDTQKRAQARWIELTMDGQVLRTE